MSSYAAQPDDWSIDDLMAKRRKASPAPVAPEPADWSIDDIMAKRGKPAPDGGDLRERAVAILKTPLNQRIGDILDEYGQFEAKRLGKDYAGYQPVLKAGRAKAPDGTEIVRPYDMSPRVFLTGDGGKVREIGLGQDVETKIQSAREEQSALLRDVERAGGTVSSWDRLRAGLKQTPAGKLDYIKETFKPENVFPVTDDAGDVEQIVILEPGQKPRVFDGTGFGDIGKDLLDWSGGIVESAPGTVAEIIGTARGGKVVGAAAGAAGDALGSVMRQGISAALPGEDYPADSAASETGQRLASGAANVAGGLVGEGLGTAGSKALNWARPGQGLGGRHVAGGKMLVRETG